MLVDAAEEVDVAEEFELELAPDHVREMVDSEELPISAERVVLKPAGDTETLLRTTEFAMRAIKL